METAKNNFLGAAVGLMSLGIVVGVAKKVTGMFDGLKISSSKGKKEKTKWL
jgi:hypothetical protein